MQLTADTVYKCTVRTQNLKASVVITGGTIDMYFSNKTTIPASTSDTSFELDTDGAGGNFGFRGYPRYLYYAVASGVPVVEENSLVAPV